MSRRGRAKRLVVVRELRDKLDDIKRHEEKLRCIDALRRQRMLPQEEAQRVVARLEEEYRRALAARDTMTAPDMEDLDQREQEIRDTIERLKTEAARIIGRNQKFAIDTSPSGS